MLTVIIPTRNSPLVGDVIREIQEAERQPNARNVFRPEIIVAGYRSPAKTRIDTERLGGKFIDVLRKGKVAGLQDAVAYVGTPFCAMVDADTTYPTRYLRIALRELQTGADIVIGYRKWREQGSMSRLNVIGNWGLSILASVLYRHGVRDVCTGMWAFRTEILRKFELTSSGFQLEADLFVNAVRNKCKIVEIPIEYRKKPEYKKGIGLKEGISIGWFLVKSRFQI